jgi:hypothetical protein
MLLVIDRDDLARSQATEAKPDKLKTTSERLWTGAPVDFLT